MPIIELKCPGCTGQIQMDTSKEFSFCTYCGNRFLVQDEVQKILLKVEHSGIVNIQDAITVKNLLKRANEFLSSGHYELAIEYYDKVLDRDPENNEAKAKLWELNRAYINGKLLSPQNVIAFEKILSTCSKYDAVSFVCALTGADWNEASGFV